MGKIAPELAVRNFSRQVSSHTKFSPPPYSTCSRVGFEMRDCPGPCSAAVHCRRAARRAAERARRQRCRQDPPLQTWAPGVRGRPAGRRVCGRGVRAEAWHTWGSPEDGGRPPRQRGAGGHGRRGGGVGKQPPARERGQDGSQVRCHGRRAVTEEDWQTQWPQRAPRGRFHTAPIVTLCIPGTPLKPPCPLQKQA